MTVVDGIDWEWRPDSVSGFEITGATWHDLGDFAGAHPVLAEQLFGRPFVEGESGAAELVGIDALVGEEIPDAVFEALSHDLDVPDAIRHAEQELGQPDPDRSYEESGPY